MASVRLVVCCLVLVAFLAGTAMIAPYIGDPAYAEDMDAPKKKKKTTKKDANADGLYEQARTYRVANLTDAGQLIVRDAATEAGRAIAQLPADSAGIRVSSCRMVAGYQHRWCLIKHNGVTGWVNQGNLELQ